MPLFRQLARGPRTAESRSGASTRAAGPRSGSTTMNRARDTFAQFQSATRPSSSLGAATDWGSPISLGRHDDAVPRGRRSRRARTASLARRRLVLARGSARAHRQYDRAITTLPSSRRRTAIRCSSRAGRGSAGEPRRRALSRERGAFARISRHRSQWSGASWVEAGLALAALSIPIPTPPADAARSRRASLAARRSAPDPVDAGHDRRQEAGGGPGAHAGSPERHAYGTRSAPYVSC